MNAAEGRNPGPDFHSARYFNLNPGAIGEGLPALAHYLQAVAPDITAAESEETDAAG